MGLQLRDRDQGYKKRLDALRAAAGGDSSTGRGGVLVGIRGDKAAATHKGSDLDLVTIASFHEFGIGVPERSIIRAWVDEEREKITDLIRRAARAMAAGKVTRAQALELVGAKCVAMVQARIKRGIAPALSAATVAEKGSDVPLIDSGQLWSSITDLVEKIVG